MKTTPSSPAAQLNSLLDKFDAKDQKLIRSVRTALRKRFATANELVYDYGSSLVIAYSPTDRGIDASVSFSARSTGIALYFNQGPRLPDPKNLLRGSGKQTRFIELKTASQLTHPDVKALITAAVELTKSPAAAAEKGTLIIKSDGAKKPARKKASKTAKAKRSRASARVN